MTIESLFKSHNIPIVEQTFVMCVKNSLIFEKGKFYPVINGSIKSNKSMNIKSMINLNESFIPLEGGPNNLTLKDRLMILIRMGS